METTTTTVNVTPLHDRVLVRRLEEKDTARGGIIIPDTAKEKPQEAEVMAVGAGRLKSYNDPSKTWGAQTPKEVASKHPKWPVMTTRGGAICVSFGNG
jgi:hypothetical protein